MKILNVTVLLDPVSGGGTAERTFQLSRHLAAAGHDVTVLTTDIGLTPERLASMGSAKVVAMTCWFKRFFIVAPKFGVIDALVRNADAIHLMGHWNMLNVLVYLAARKQRVPYAICPAGELRLFGRSRGLKTIFNALVGKRMVRDASAWIAVTADEKPQYADYGIAGEAVSVIPNGVVVDDVRNAGASSVLERLHVLPKTYILFMGRLNPIKGPDLLLDAFAEVAAKYPDVHLVFAGPDGGLREALGNSVKASGLDTRVHFAGYVSGADKAALYAQALFLAIPSRHEAMSIVVLEAGAAGVPALITDRCGFDLLEAAGGGLVVPASVPGLASGLSRMLAARNTFAKMSDAIHTMVLEHYTWDIAVARHVEVLSAIANETRSRSGSAA